MAGNVAYIVHLPSVCKIPGLIPSSETNQRLAPQTKSLLISAEEPECDLTF